MNLLFRTPNSWDCELFIHALFSSMFKTTRHTRMVTEIIIDAMAAYTFATLIHADDSCSIPPSVTRPMLESYASRVRKLQLQNSLSIYARTSVQPLVDYGRASRCTLNMYVKHYGGIVGVLLKPPFAKINTFCNYL